MFITWLHIFECKDGSVLHSSGTRSTGLLAYMINNCKQSLQTHNFLFHFVHSENVCSALFVIFNKQFITRKSHVIRLYFYSSVLFFLAWSRLGKIKLTSKNTLPYCISSCVITSLYLNHPQTVQFLHLKCSPFMLNCCLMIEWLHLITGKMSDSSN